MLQQQKIQFLGMIGLGLSILMVLQYQTHAQVIVRLLLSGTLLAITMRHGLGKLVAQQSATQMGL